MADYRGEEVDLQPTEEMARVTKRALEWRGEFNRGGTEVGVARARDISNRSELSADTVRRMVSFFARHEVDKQAEGFNSGEDGFPSAGRIAWDLWGGDPGKTWAEARDRRLDAIDESKGSMTGVMKKMVVPLDLKEVKVDDDGFVVFEGYASTYGNVDRGGDIVTAGAFDETVKQFGAANPLPILWQHKHDMPLGVYTDISSDSKGLFVRGRMPRDDAFVRDRVLPQMRVGSIRKMSIGYITKDYEWDGPVRKLNELDLLEVSLVTIPMNESADVTGFKSVVSFQDLPLADREREWDSAAAIARVREWADAEDDANDRYRRAFLWFDRENADEFGAYKLPIADVIDGRLTAIPRGVFAAAAVVFVARGGVDIPDTDRSGVVENINRYYEKMGLDSPFQERMCFRVDAIDAYTERQLEKLLKHGVLLPGEQARKIISAHKSLMRDAEKTEKRDADLSPSLEKLTSLIKGLGNNDR